MPSIVTSPHTLHFEHARLALERGLHVLCEKPMCTRGDHARELVRLASEKGLHLLVPYGWHYKPFIQQAKRWMDEGVVGTGAVRPVPHGLADPRPARARPLPGRARQRPGRRRAVPARPEDLGRSRRGRRRLRPRPAVALDRHAVLAHRA